MDSHLINDYKVRQCPVDTWTTREQLCLNSAVLQTGDQNWMAVSRAIRQITVETDRPPDWYSTKNCALQYAKLLEHVDTPKRKREKGEGLQNETPGEMVTKMLSKKRVEELKGILEEEKATFYQLRKEVLHLESNQSDSRLHQYWEEILREQELEDEKAAKLEEFHREREEKIENFLAATKLQIAKAPVMSSPRKNISPIKPPSAQSIKKPSSPVDSLNMVEMDVEQGSFEDIHSAVSDEPRSSDHESPAKSICEEPAVIRNEVEQIVEENFAIEVKEEEALKPSGETLEEMKCDTSFETNIPLDYTSNLNAEMKDQDHDICPEDEKKVMDVSDINEYKNETPVKASDTQEFEEQLSKEESEKEDLGEQPKEELESEEEREIDEEDMKQETLEDEESEKMDGESYTKEDENEMEDEEERQMEKGDEEREKRREKEGKKRGRKKKMHIFSLSSEDSKPPKLSEDGDLVVKKEADDSDYDVENRKMSGCLMADSVFSSLPFDFASSSDKEGGKRSSALKHKEARDEYEFEDDASRDSTDVKDYMYRGERRKFCSLGESVSSPVVSESTPSSPASTNYGDDPEAEKLHRSWKRSIMLIWNDIAAHKNASIFLKPITEDKVPGYHSIVFKPIDLMSIKRNIESGTIRSTSDFQRDVMLMFLNAKMYNTRDHNVYRMAEHMMSDAVETIEEFINAQMLAKVVETPQKTLRRETRESSAKRVGEDMKRKREERDEKSVKRRKV